MCVCVCVCVCVIWAVCVAAPSSTVDTGRFLWWLCRGLMGESEEMDNQHQSLTPATHTHTHTHIHTHTNTHTVRNYPFRKEKHFSLICRWLCLNHPIRAQRLTRCSSTSLLRMKALQKASLASACSCCAHFWCFNSCVATSELCTKPHSEKTGFWAAEAANTSHRSECRETTNSTERWTDLWESSL